MYNPTLFSLLGKGAKIVFPDGYSIYGREKSIFVTHDLRGAVGVFDFSKFGLEQAFDRLSNDRKIR